MTIKAAYDDLVNQLSTIYEDREAQNVARILFEDAFGITNFDRTEELSKRKQKRLRFYTKRLLRHEPVQYVVGQADFFGLKFYVDKRVLIPRPETEEVTQWVIDTLKSDYTEIMPKVLDIGTGSGCIPITLMKKVPNIEAWGIDISRPAIKAAATNAFHNEVPVHLQQLNILARRKWDRQPNFHLIVSNPPYIPVDEKKLMPERVKKFEPTDALFVKNDNPIFFYDVISDFAKEKLYKGGHLFFETNEFNAEKVVAMLENKGFESVELRKDMSGKDRMVRAVKA